MDKSHCCTSARINSRCFLLISFKAFPTDFRRYSLLCALCLLISSIANKGLFLKNGRLVQILNPSVTARITFGLLSFNHSSMSSKDVSYPLCLQTFLVLANFYQCLFALSENKVHYYPLLPIYPIPLLPTFGLDRLHIQTT